MALLADITLTPVTLLLVFVLPFFYFGYHAKLWYAPERIKLFDSVLLAVAALLGIAVLGRMYYAVLDHESIQIQLALSHLCVFALTVLMVTSGRSLVETNAVETAGHAPVKSPEEFAPKARNAEVEAIAWEDLIIDEGTKNELTTVINLLKNPEAAKQYGIALPKGILFNGPPGTGKTTIAKAVASLAGLNFFVLRANEVVSKWVGESEKNLTKLFEAAMAATPAVIFIDEIDSLGKKRSDSSTAHGDNLLNHLLQLMDGVLKSDGIYIIAATNRADLVDEALRRAGRLNRVIEIPLPDLTSRRKLLQVYTRNLRLASDIDLEALAQVTDGNSGADIKAMCNQAGLYAYEREQRLPEERRTQLVISADIEEALSLFAAEEKEDDVTDILGQESKEPLNGRIERIGWDDIVIDDEVKQELTSVIALLKDPSTAARYGITVPKGILLNGPPGTGKTTLAKVIANEAGLAFFALQTDEIVSKWVGESEKNLTRFFKNALKHSPSVIFIDEIDSIAKNRAEGNAAHADNLLNHLLQLLDGVVKHEGIYVIGATNRADLVDPALKRGGRLNKVVQVPLPSQAARKALFRLYLSKLPLSGAVNVEHLAAATNGKCAADIKEICNQAGLNAFKRESSRGNREYSVAPIDLDRALEEWTAARVP